MKILIYGVLLSCASALVLHAESESGLVALQSYAKTLEGERREAADFLLEHLPEADRKELAVELFQENLEQAFIARERYPWTQELSKEIFYNDVLPHAVVTETRDAWRKQLRELLDSKLTDCKTRTEAYAAVGAQIKELTGVDYNTKREKACQSPAESMRQGMASCTGLSILMVDALRASGLPARLAAIPLWGTKEGNHTWIEVHDGENWRFSGYGGSPDRWDKGWEIDRCAFSDPLEPIHGIFASSYKPTPVDFPTSWDWRGMNNGPYCAQERDEKGQLTSLKWSFQPGPVGGVDRTRHYIELAGGRKFVIPKGEACISVRAFLKDSQTRVDLPVRIRRGNEVVFTGRTASEALDLNDYVRVTCQPGELTVEHQAADGTWTAKKIEAPADKETSVRLDVSSEEATGLLDIKQRRALASWFRAGGAEWPSNIEWPKLKDAASVDKARAELWSIYSDAHRLDTASKELGPLPESLKQIAESSEVGKTPLPTGALTLGKHSMPFVLVRKEPNPVPEKGRALYICMHGGGCNPNAGGPHEWAVNTGEWNAQASLAANLYAGEGIFFVPRMADDRLGRWHHDLNQDAFDAVVEHGIREWNVDPDRVYLMGISEGCYGTQILAPFMPDRFGGACAMAGGVGNDVPAENLRNLAFRTDVGENDTTFNRVGLAREFHARMDESAKTWQGYTNSINVQKGKGHGLDYSLGPKWMIQHTRTAYPDTIVWTAKEHHGRRRSAYYWLGLEGKKLEGTLNLAARLKGNTLDLKATTEDDKPPKDIKIRLMLNDEMIDLDAPLVLRLNGEPLGVDLPSRSIESLARTLDERGDPTYAFPVTVDLDL